MFTSNILSVFLSFLFQVFVFCQFSQNFGCVDLVFHNIGEDEFVNHFAEHPEPEGVQAHQHAVEQHEELLKRVSARQLEVMDSIDQVRKNHKSGVEPNDHMQKE